MIYMPVDESYAFDMLAILECKMERCDRDKYAELEFSHKTIADKVVGQIGNQQYFNIIFSEEYKRLFNINIKIFDKLDDLKNGKNFSAEVIDDLNYQRYLAKKALQEEFFGVDSMSEQKLGYEKVDVNL